MSVAALNQAHRPCATVKNLLAVNISLVKLGGGGEPGGLGPG